MIRRLVILGATGDLTSRYLLPALARLHEGGRLPDALSIVGSARDDRETAGFRQHILERLDHHAQDITAASRRAVASRLEYRRADVTDPAALAKVFGGTRDPVVAYLALPPSVYVATVGALAAVGLAEGSRIVIEKPFGEDLVSEPAAARSPS